MMRTDRGAGECVCVRDSFFYGHNLGLICISSYIDFSRAMSGCLNSGHLNRKASATSVFRVQANSEKALTAVAQRVSKTSSMLQMEQPFFLSK